MTLKEKLKREFLLEMGIEVCPAKAKVSPSSSSSMATKQAAPKSRTRALKRVSGKDADEYRKKAQLVEKRVRLRRMKLLAQQKEEEKRMAAFDKKTASIPRSTDARPRHRRRKVRACLDVYHLTLKAYRSVSNDGAPVPLSDVVWMFENMPSNVFLDVAIPDLQKIDTDGDKMISEHEISSFLLNALNLLPSDVLAPVADAAPPKQSSDSRPQASNEAQAAADDDDIDPIAAGRKKLHELLAK